jgi:hypothetical protein
VELCLHSPIHLLLAWHFVEHRGNLTFTFTFGVNVIYRLVKCTVYPSVVTGETNSPTVGHACRKTRLKWVLGAWGYNWATQSPGYINMETWSSRLGVGHGADDPHTGKSQQLGNLRFGLGTDRSIVK